MARLPSINQGQGELLQGELSFPSQAEDFRTNAEIQKDLLTKMASSLLDISANVSIMADILPNLLEAQKELVGKSEEDTLKQEEMNRESKVKGAAAGVLTNAAEGFFGFFEKAFAVLTPFLLGVALAFMDLQNPVEMLKDALKGLAIFIAGKFMWQLLKAVTLAFVTEKIKSVMAGKAAGAAADLGTGGIAGPVGGAGTGAGTNVPGGTGGGLAGLAKGIEAFGTGGVTRGILNLTLAGVALAGVAYLFKQGDYSWEDLGKAGVGLAGLAVGVAALGNPLAQAGLKAIGSPATIKGLAVLAGAVAALGVALIPGAYAFKLFGEATQEAAKGFRGMIDNLNRLSEIDPKKISALGPAMAKLGLGFAAFNAAMIGGTLAGIGASIAKFFGAESPMDQVLRFGKEAQEADLIGAAKAVDALTNSLLRLNSLELNNLSKIGEGLLSMSAGLAAFSVANVATGVGNLVNRFLNFISGGKNPIEQIAELSKDSTNIYQAGMGIQALGNGMVAFNSVDPEKLTRSVQIVTELSEEQIAVLAKVSAVGTQLNQVQRLGETREATVQLKEQTRAKEIEATKQQGANINIARGGDVNSQTVINQRPLEAEPTKYGLGSKR